MSLISECRSCGNHALSPVISLGHMPLANSLLAETELGNAEPMYPLDVVFCSECSLVQITETVDPEDLFSDYLYFSSFSSTLLAHSEALVDRVRELLNLDATSLAMEIASNDGYLLQYYQKNNIPVLGIEPAINIAEVAQRDKGVRTICEFFGTELAESLVDQGLRADVIHANNVLAHVADLNGVVQGMQMVLADRGVAIIETPYVRDLVDHCEFDTIYHEHLCYYSVSSLKPLFERHGLVIAGVEHVPIHGGSLRLYVTKPEARDLVTGVIADPAIFIEEEIDRGVTNLNFYLQFRERVEASKERLLNYLNDLKNRGDVIAGYAAAAKATVILNYCGLDSTVIDFVVDKSPHKQGRFIPGVRIPIVEPSSLSRDMPDATVLFAWNIAEEILKEQTEYVGKGGRFLIPLPEPKFI